MTATSAPVSTSCRTVRVGGGDVSTGLDQLSHRASVATLAGETQACYIVCLMAKSAIFYAPNFNLVFFPQFDRRVRDVNLKMIFVIQRLNQLQGYLLPIVSLQIASNKTVLGLGVGC